MKRKNGMRLFVACRFDIMVPEGRERPRVIAALKFFHWFAAAHDGAALPAQATCQHLFKLFREY